MASQNKSSIKRVQFLLQTLQGADIRDWLDLQKQTTMAARLVLRFDLRRREVLPTKYHQRHGINVEKEGSDGNVLLPKRKQTHQ